MQKQPLKPSPKQPLKPSQKQPLKPGRKQPRELGAKPPGRLGEKPPETTSAPPWQLVVMGRIAVPFGVKGWMKVQPFSARPENLLAYPVWRIGDETGWQECRVEEAKVRGRSLVAKLAGCEDRDTALTYRGRQVAVARDALPTADANEYYWSDLIGLEVVNAAGENLGTVSRVFETGANDVLVVEGERERLIPFTAEVVRRVEVAKGVIRVEWGADY